jgi:hypothetical protein
MQRRGRSVVEITHSINHLFESLSREFRKATRRPERTQQVLRAVAELGQAQGWGVCGSGLDKRFPGHFESGWLYDLVWYRNKSEGELHLSHVELALECEWKNLEHIRVDFEKLLLAKAPIKIMVFKADSNAIEGTFEFLNTAIESFDQTSTGETYFFAGFDNGTQQFEVRVVST